VEVRPTADGSLVAVRVRPRSRPDVGIRDGVVTLSVAAPPVDGKATEEARRALAAALGVAPSRVRLHAGATSRRKVFEVAGMAPEQAERLLKGLSR
jgi:uncharacterized protein